MTKHIQPGQGDLFEKHYYSIAIYDPPTEDGKYTVLNHYGTLMEMQKDVVRRVNEFHNRARNCKPRLRSIELCTRVPYPQKIEEVIL